jgi:hypothetical protein
MASRPIAVSVEEDAPPLVRTLAADLAARLEDTSFVAETERLSGVVSVRQSDGAQSATLRLAARAVSLSHGVAEDADLTATIDPDGAAPGVESDGEHPELARWLAALVGPPAVEWPEAAERYWSVLSALRGAPTALRVVDLDSSEERTYGSEGGPTYEIHGSREGLVGVFSGRTPLIDAAFEGRVLIRGTFPQLSVLTGACYAVRFGDGAEHA